MKMARRINTIDSIDMNNLYVIHDSIYNKRYICIKTEEEPYKESILVDISDKDIRRKLKSMLSDAWNNKTKEIIKIKENGSNLKYNCISFSYKEYKKKEFCEIELFRYNKGDVNFETNTVINSNNIYYKSNKKTLDKNDSRRLYVNL